MDVDYAMDDASTLNSTRFTQQISATEYDRQAVEFTTEEVERLNAAVRAQPKLGARSKYFQDEENVAKGLPVFQGRHMRFVYDDESGGIVAAVDVTQEALNNGPVVRTVAELDEDIDGEVEADDDDEYDEEQDQEETVQNTFYNTEKENDLAMGDAHVNSLMQDVEMEMASVAIHEHELLLSAAVKRQ